MPLVRAAKSADLQPITDIYNSLIETTNVAWSETPQSIEERRSWFERQTQSGFPVLAAVDDDSENVIGFASYGHFRGAGVWPGYRFTVEHSVYVRQGTRKQGVGKQLMLALIDRAIADGIHVMVGALDSTNDASLRFHERLGFVEVARMPEVGFKFGQWLDLVMVQRILDQT